MALTDNLLAFYKLDDLTDSSGNGNTLTNNGGVTFSSGKIGNAATYTNESYLEGSDSTFPLGNSSRTMSVWFKTSFTNGFRIFYGYPTGNNLFGLYNEGDFFSFSGWGNDHITSTNISDGAWHHGVAVHDSTSGLTLYLDGTPVLTVETEFDTTSSSFVIGRTADGAAIPPEGASCEVDAVGIWNRALNSTEVAELYNSGNGLEEFGGAPATQSFVKIQDSAKFLGKVKFIS